MTGKQTVRIIGGKWRSRLLPFPDIAGLRPSQDRIRETLFNWLMPTIQNARCLDVFAGSGVLGFEALSRGAQFCCFIDNDPSVIKQLRINAEKLAIDPAQLAILRGVCPQQVPPLPHAPFDIIFLDPPFQKNLLAPTIDWLIANNYCHTDSLIYIEMEKYLQLPLPTTWQIHRQAKTATLLYQLICLT